MDFVVGVEEGKDRVEAVGMVFVDDMGEFVADEIIDNFYRCCHDFPIVRYCIVAAAHAPAGFVGFDEDFRGIDGYRPG